MVKAATRFLNWYSVRVLLFNDRPISPAAGAVWYAFVIFPSTVVLMPMLALCGVIEAISVGRRGGW